MSNIPQWAQDEIRKVSWSTERELVLDGTRQKEKLNTIPDAIFKLKHLKKLSLSNNQIKIIPNEVDKLENLWFLDLSHNEITTIPEAVTKLRWLEFIKLNNNQLKSIPDSIGQLTSLDRLYLADNQITSIPATILDLYRLTDFYVKNNPIHSPPPEILNLSEPRGRVDIPKMRSYFRQIIDEGEDFFFEAKLIIIGNPRVGKTSLAGKILNPKKPLPHSENTTRGIDIHEWDFPLSSEILKQHDAQRNNKKNFNVHIWDFGGHDIYHSTHKFFLTKRSLYILVADANERRTDFAHWLYIAETLSRKSPLIVVINRKGDREWAFGANQFRGLFGSLKGVHNINLKKIQRGGEDNFTSLVNEIKFRISELPHIGTRLPAPWVKVRQALENEKRPYIFQQEYFNICNRNGLSSGDHEKELELSQYLHDLGVCLHFHRHHMLGDIVILDPEWGVNAVYMVLDDPDVIDKYGHFKYTDLNNLWPKNIYEGMYNRLLALMEEFHLCYEIPAWDGKSKQYIAPQLLREEPPAYKWNKNDNLHFCYQMPEFMPRGIISYFIVAMHKNIEGQELVWRDGVVLNFEGTRAEVVVRRKEKEIKIRMSGNNQRDHLANIRWAFGRIYEEAFPNIPYNELVPCICSECRNSQSSRYYSLGDLFNLLEKARSKKSDPRVICLNSGDVLDIQDLIDNIGYSKDNDDDNKEYNEGEYDLKALRRGIERTFDEEELLVFCKDYFDLNYANLAGIGRLNKIVELIKWAERRGQLGVLVRACEKERSRWNWPQKKPPRISG